MRACVRARARVHVGGYEWRTHTADMWLTCGLRRAACLINCDVNQKRFVVVDGDFLASLLQVDRLVNVVERPSLAHLHCAAKWNALAERVVPRKKGIPREQRIDDRLRTLDALGLGFTCIQPTHA